MLGLVISNNATTGGGEDVTEELAQEDAEDFTEELAQEDGEDFTEELANVPASSEESDGGHGKVPSTTGLGLPEGKKGTRIRSKTKPYIPPPSPPNTRIKQPTAFKLKKPSRHVYLTIPPDELERLSKFDIKVSKIVGRTVNRRIFPAGG